MKHYIVAPHREAGKAAARSMGWHPQNVITLTRDDSVYRLYGLKDVTINIVTSSRPFQLMPSDEIAYRRLLSLVKAISLSRNFRLYEIVIK